jgi:hypothetical protein
LTNCNRGDDFAGLDGKRRARSLTAARNTVCDPQTGFDQTDG